MDRTRILTVVRVVTAALIVLAIAVQATELARVGRFDPTTFFAFFTIQSNLIAAAVLSLLVARRGRPRSLALEVARGAAALYLTITFWVVILLLSGEDLQVALVWVDVIVHKISPVVVVADWLLDPPRRPLAPRHVLVWLVFPLGWLIVTLFRGAADGWYPYPFLDPAAVGGYGAVAVYVVAILLGFLAVAAALAWLGDRRRARLAGQPA